MASEDLENDLYKNWVRGAKGLEYLQEGLQDFVGEKVQHCRDQHLQKITNGLPTGSLHQCNQCTSQNLLPEHAKKKNACNRSTCIALYSNNCFGSKPNGRRKCPNGICSKLYDEIVFDHSSRDPLWKNTDPSTWCSNASGWSFGKCFQTTTSPSTSADTTDAAGLLSILINNLTIQNDWLACNDMSSKITCPFNRARDIRNAILHSPKLELDGPSLGYYLDTFITVLQDTKCLLNCSGSKQAVDKLLQLKNHQTNISLEDEKTLLKSRKEALSELDEKILEGQREIDNKIEASLSDLEKAKIGAEQDVRDSKKDALSDLEKAKIGAEQDVRDSRKVALSDLEKAKIGAEQDVRDSKKAVLSDLEQAKIGAEQNVKMSTKAALSALEDAKREAGQDVKESTKAALSDLEQVKIGAEQNVKMSTKTALSALEDAKREAGQDVKDSTKAALSDLERAKIGAEQDVRDSTKASLLDLEEARRETRKDVKESTKNALSNLEQARIGATSDIDKRKETSLSEIEVAKCDAIDQMKQQQTSTVLPGGKQSSTSHYSLQTSASFSGQSVKTKTPNAWQRFLRKLQMPGIKKRGPVTSELPVNMAAMQQPRATVQSPHVEGVTDQTTTKLLVTVAWLNCIFTLDRTSGWINVTNKTGVRYQLDHCLLRECSIYLCDDSTLKRVHLTGINIGTATVNITLSKETVIKLSEKGPKGTTEEILRQLPEQTEFDNDDLEIERANKNAIGQHIILDRVCSEIIDRHSATLPILYVYPAYDESCQVTIVCLLSETFNRSSNKLDRFRNFPVKLAPYYPLSKESLHAESVIDRNDKGNCTVFKDNLQLLDEIVSEHVDSLMMKHSNLEAIKVSKANSHKRNADTSSPCVVFFCRCKSYIPYGEEPFPKKLKHSKQDISFPTDVREGYYIQSTARFANVYNKEMAMGCSIGTQNVALSATLGPFVEIKETSDVCFLTVRHLFAPPKSAEELIGTKLVQPAVLDMTVSDGNQVAASSVTGPSTVCGEVIVAEINDHVDAALVKIEDERVPKQGHFISVSRRELEFAGFSENDLPKFEDGSTMDARIQKVNTYATDRVIKFGKRTGLTKGCLSLSCMAVRNNYGGTGCVTFQGQQYTHVIKNQLQVDSFAAQNVFFQEGDSGSSVFLVDKNNRLYCIGMAIGALSDCTCVVTPIQNILHALGGKLNKTLEIKAFRQ